MAIVKKQTQKSNAAPKAAQAPTQKAETPLSDQVMKVTVSGRETNQNIITDKISGKERWFVKAEIKGFKEVKPGQFEITATRREFGYRDMLDQAKPA